MAGYFAASNRTHHSPESNSSVFGFVIGDGGFGIAELDLDHGAVHMLAEATVILLLFSGADYTHSIATFCVPLHHGRNTPFCQARIRHRRLTLWYLRHILGDD